MQEEEWVDDAATYSLLIIIKGRETKQEQTNNTKK